MIQNLYEQNIFTYVFLGIFSFGFMIRFLVACTYKSLIKNSKRMGTTNNKLMKTVRIKFETCYKLQLGVNNVDIFVDKYVFRHKVCGIYLYSWETFSGLISIVEVLSASIIALLGIYYKCGQTRILSTFAFGIGSALMLITLDYIINIRTKKKILKTNMKDYLLNYLKVKMEHPSVCTEVMEQYRKTCTEQTNRTSKKGNSKIDIPMVDEESAATKIALTDPVARREAKKNELRKMIEEDKKERTEQIEQTKIADVEKEKKEKKKQIKKEACEDRQLHLTNEEEKVIEDILKEYLA